MNTYIIIAIYWVVAIVATYVIRYYQKKKKRLLNAVLEAFDAQPKTPLWKHIATHAFIVLLLPPLMPIVIVVLLISKLKTKSSKKKNDKKDEAPKAEKTVDIKTNCEDAFEKASFTMKDAIKTGDFEQFEALLTDDVKTICYNVKTIRGKKETLDYWKDWMERFVKTGKIEKFQVVKSFYNSQLCLMLNASMFVMFQIKDGIIHSILLTPIHLSSKYADDNMFNSPLDYERIKQYLKPLTEDMREEDEQISIDNRIPCFNCGLESSELKWYRSIRPDKYDQHWEIGQVSICPQCGSVIEYKRIKNVQSDDVVDNYQGPKYPDKDSVLSEMASKIYSTEMTDRLRDGNREDFVKYLLSQLKDIELEPGCSFEISALDNSGMGDNTELYVVDKYGNKSTNFVKNFIVNITETAALQLYLLQNISTVLPAFWHGGYNERKYIFKESDIDNIYPLKYHNITDLFKLEYILPKVRVFTQDEHNGIFLVSCTFWNEWKGLVRECVTISIQNDHVVKYASKLTYCFHYDCGIMF